MEIYKLTIKKEIQLSLSKVIFFVKQMSQREKGDFQDVTGWILVRKVLNI
jgi:hypothetical protein